MTSGKATYAKAHAKGVADEYLRLGWTLVSEFRVREDDEPYEYLFAWKAEGEPVYIDWNKFKASHDKGLTLAAIRTACAFTPVARNPPTPGDCRACFIGRKPSTVRATYA